MVRILEKDCNLRHLLTLVIESAEAKVIAGNVPDFCPAYRSPLHPETCPARCANLLIIDAHLTPMPGIDWVEAQARTNCHIPVADKLLLATHSNEATRQRAEACGCQVMRKPFRNEKLKAWIKARLA